MTLVIGHTKTCTSRSYEIRPIHLVRNQNVNIWRQMEMRSISDKITRIVCSLFPVPFGSGLLGATLFLEDSFDFSLLPSVQTHSYASFSSSNGEHFGVGNSFHLDLKSIDLHATASMPSKTLFNWIRLHREFSGTELITANKQLSFPLSRVDVCVR